jgi:RNA polymerase sigma factor (sigma-70 family)
MANETSRQLFERLRDGDSRAAADVFDRYCRRLIALVRVRMSPRLGQRVDPEDVVQSALRSFFVRAGNDEFVFQQSGDLWRLLAAITLSKLRRQVEVHTAEKRAVAKEQPGGELKLMAVTADREPQPGDEAALLEELEQVLEKSSPLEREALERRLAGETIEEIAASMGRSQRTVRRLLQTCREALERRLAAVSDEFPAALGAIPKAARHDGDASANRQRRSPPKSAVDPRAPLPWSDYLVQEHLGSGGFGKVYRALQKSLGRPVAVKALRKSRQHDPQAVEQFIQEARVLARLRHPGIVGIQGLGRFPGGGHFLVLDLIEGEDLQRRIERERPSIDEALRITIAVAEAIQYAHEHGVIHGDLKPSNVLVDRVGGVYVTDFGLARLLPSATSDDAPSEFPGGTLAYLAPEVARGEAARESVDVYGLGALLYALLTGQRPRQGDGDAIVADLRAGRAPPRPSTIRADVPPAVEAVVMRCLEARIDARFANVAGVVAALQ